MMKPEFYTPKKTLNMLYFPAASDEQLYYSFQGKLRLVVCNQVQVCDVLKECHDNLGSGGHPGRRRTTEKVLASYHWKTLREDVNKWVSVISTEGNVLAAFIVIYMLPIRSDAFKFHINCGAFHLVCLCNYYAES